MAETQTITTVLDSTTWQGMNRPPGGSNSRVHVSDGVRRGWLMPLVPALAGETVVSVILRGHPDTIPATTWHLDAVTSKWSAGKITHGNRPTVDATRRASTTTGAMTSGVVEWDITSILADVAAGETWWGLRLVSESTTIGSWYSNDSGRPAWELELTLGEESDAPDNLRPDGGAVSADRPVLAWDTEGQVAFRIDLYADEDTDVASWSSPWVVSPVANYALPAGAPAGGWHWTVTKQDADGQELVSDRASWTVTPWADLIVDSPTGTFGDTSPDLVAHPVSGSVAWWSAMVTGPSRADVRFETGVQPSPIDTTLPEKNRQGRRLFTAGADGWIGLTWSDGVQRATAVGDPAARTVWIPAPLGASGGVTAPSSLTVTQLAEGDPRLVWQWERTEVADAWRLQVDGRDVRRVTSGECEVSGGVYTFTDAGEVQPMRPHVLTVVAVESGQASPPSPEFASRHVVTGFWVLHPEKAAPAVVLDDTPFESIGRADQTATYTILNGDEVDVVYGRPGYKGDLKFSVSTAYDRQGDGVWEALDVMDDLVDDLNRTRRIVWGSRTMMARFRSPGHVPAADMLDSNKKHIVIFGIVQTGD